MFIRVLATSGAQVIECLRVKLYDNELKLRGRHRRRILCVIVPAFIKWDWERTQKRSQDSSYPGRDLKRASLQCMSDPYCLRQFAR